MGFCFAYWHAKQQVLKEDYREEGIYVEGSIPKELYGKVN